MGQFNNYSRYYDALYSDKDTNMECLYTMNLLERFKVPGKDWLELGAGSGRHGLIFKEKGVNWSGIEASEEMVSIAYAKGLEVKLGDLRNASFLPHQFHAVMALFHVISYLPSNNDVLAAFVNVERHLVPGGLFLFDIWFTPAVCSQKPEKRKKEFKDRQLNITRDAIPTIDWMKNTVNVHYDIDVIDGFTGLRESFSEDHLMRHFGLPEIEFLANSVGLDLVNAEEWLTGRQPGLNTWGVCCILKKPI